MSTDIESPPEPLPLSRLGEIEAAYQYYKSLQEAYRRDSGAQTLELAHQLFDHFEKSGDYFVEDLPEWDTSPGQSGRIYLRARPRDGVKSTVVAWLYARADGTTRIELEFYPDETGKALQLIDAWRLIDKSGDDECKPT